jgi:hypothetical protein
MNDNRRPTIGQTSEIDRYNLWLSTQPTETFRPWEQVRRRYLPETVRREREARETPAEAGARWARELLDLLRGGTDG